MLNQMMKIESHFWQFVFQEELADNLSEILHLFKPHSLQGKFFVPKLNMVSKTF